MGEGGGRWLNVEHPTSNVEPNPGVAVNRRTQRKQRINEFTGSEVVPKPLPWGYEPEILCGSFQPMLPLCALLPPVPSSGSF